MAWTAEQDAIIRKRYPTEGASEELRRDLGVAAWRIRQRAGVLKVRMDAVNLRRKKLQYNGGLFGW